MEVTPFTEPVILVNILIRLDRDTLEFMYRHYKEILDTPYVLKQLEEIHGLSDSKSFADFIVSYDIQDPTRRTNVCMSETQMIKYALRQQNIPLLSQLLDVWTVADGWIFRDIGKTGNMDLIMAMLQHQNGRRNILYILEGLAEGCHNELFDQVVKDENNVLVERIIKCAICGGNIELFVRYYNDAIASNYMDDIIYLVAKADNLKCLKYIEEKNPELLNNHSLLFDGYMRGCHLEEAMMEYDQISEYDLDDIDEYGIIYAIIGKKNLECYQGFIKLINPPQEFCDSISEYSVGYYPNPIIDYIIEIYPYGLRSLMNHIMWSDDLFAIIEAYNKYKLSIDLPDLIKRFTNTKKGKNCLKWLRLQ